MKVYELELLEQWWAIPSDDEALGKRVFETVSAIEKSQSSMRAKWAEYARYYSNREEFGLNWEVEGGMDAYESLVTENIVKSVVDTATAMIANSRVKPRVMTNGGDWSEQRKAIKLEAWTYGELKKNEIWDESPEALRAGIVFGTACYKTIPQPGKGVKLEHVLIPEIVVDERACPGGNPREIFHRKLVDKWTLASKFPRHRDAILNCESESYGGKKVPEGQIVVIEGHRLPDKQGKNGRHLITAGEIVIHDKKWKHNWFPYTFFRWDGKPISGFYGMSGVRILMGYQKRINQLNSFFKKCQDTIVSPRVFVDVASKTMKLHINNEVGAIIPYRGKPPIFMTPTAISAEMYNYKRELKASAYADFGLSQQMTTGQSQPGHDSAIAQREAVEVANSRFVINHKRFESLFVKLPQTMIKVAKTFVYKGSDKVSFKNRHRMVAVPWKDVDMEADRYVMEIEPASILSQSPSARLQAVTELAQVGQLDKAEVRYLLDHPDLRHSSNVANADFETCLRVEDALLDGEFLPPEEFMNLELMLRRMPLVANKAANDGAPPEILRLFRTWTAQAQGLLGIGQPTPVPTAPAPVDPVTGEPTNPALAAGGTPIAGGTAGSDVIQNLPGQIVA